MANQESTRIESGVRRLNYKELLEIGAKIEKTIKNESAVESFRKICSVTKLSDNLLSQGSHEDRLENTTEIVMDAQCVKMSHELLGSVIEIMDKIQISDDEYILALIRRIGPNKDWDKLADFVTKTSKSITYSQPLFGTFDEGTVIPVKEQKERRIKTKPKNTEQVKLKSIVQQKKEEQDAITVNIVGTQIAKLFELNDNQPLQYYELIIDPTNFMRTIQNAFQVSFLLRDGYVAIEQDEYGFPTVRPSNNTDKYETYDDSSHQMICNISTKLCDEMIAHYCITEPMLSPRLMNDE